MSKWTVEKARQWCRARPWIVGCNFIPSSAINQLEMWQEESYDPRTIDRELGWAGSLGFNAVRVYLHDLVWAADRDGFAKRIDDFLGIANRHGMSVLLVLFDDCHRPDPQLGKQPLPVPGVHNSGWKHSPGKNIVRKFHDGTATPSEKARLADYVQGVLTRFAQDDRVLMWDIYNEPGQSGNADDSNALLQLAWQWAYEARPSQPLTACVEGSIGEQNLALNLSRSDIITFHCYEGEALEEMMLRHLEGHSGRPVICTEYMARELGTTFKLSLPLFRNHRVGCFNWGLVAGKSQTHFNWQTVDGMERLKAVGAALEPGEPIPEPELWFHDIFRIDGTPFDPNETAFIATTIRNAGHPIPPRETGDSC